MKKISIITPTYNEQENVKLIANAIKKYTRVPKMEEIPYPAIMEPNLVVEYYSR